MSLSVAEERIRRLMARLAADEHRTRLVEGQILRTRQDLMNFRSVGAGNNARVSGVIEGCAEVGFPGATVKVYRQGTSSLMGLFTADSDGLYGGLISLATDPETVDIVATPTGTYAARFDEISVPVSLDFGTNPIDPIVIPPTEDWCCGETDYFPGDCGPTCSSLPENLYLASNYWTGKVAFNFDAGSSLWVAGVMVTGNVHDESVPGCTATTNINQTAMIYQMNTSGVLFRRVEAIAVIPAPVTVKCRQNTMPGSLTSATPFGPAFPGWTAPCAKGTHSQQKTVVCTCCPLTLSAPNTSNAPGFNTETLTITATP